MFELAHGLRFGDLYTRDGALALDALFVAAVREADAPLADRLVAARANPDALDRKSESALLIALAPHLEDFLGELFGIQDEVRALEARHHALAPLYAVKRQFVQRKAMNAYKADVAATLDGPALRERLESLIGAPLDGAGGELAFARAVLAWQGDEAAHAGALDVAMRYAAWAAHTPEGRAAHKVLFRAPRKLDPFRLVPV